MAGVIRPSGGIFSDGVTRRGRAVSCAAAVATIDPMEREDLFERVSAGGAPLTVSPAGELSVLDGGRFDVPPVRTIACPRVESTDKVRALGSSAVSSATTTNSNRSEYGERREDCHDD